MDATGAIVAGLLPTLNAATQFDPLLHEGRGLRVATPQADLAVLLAVSRVEVSADGQTFDEIAVRGEVFDRHVGYIHTARSRVFQVVQPDSLDSEAFAALEVEVVQEDFTITIRLHLSAVVVLSWEALVEYERELTRKERP